MKKTSTSRFDAPTKVLTEPPCSEAVTVTPCNNDGEIEETQSNGDISDYDSLCECDDEYEENLKNRRRNNESADSIQEE